MFAIIRKELSEHIRREHPQKVNFESWNSADYRSLFLEAFMRKYFLGTVMLIGLGGMAIAADLPVKAPAPPPVIPFDWSGAYGGSSLDWVQSRTSWQYTNPGPATLQPFTNKQNQAGWGFHAGVQQQWGQLVIGIEGDYTLLNASFVGTASNGTATSVCTANLGQSCQTNLDYLAMAGGKVGWAWTDWLFYGEGGWAGGSINTRLQNPNSSFFDTSNNNNYRNGWYAGGGIDYAIFKSAAMDVIVGADYRHVDLGNHFQASSADGIGGFGPAPPGANGRNIGATIDMVRVSLSVKTNGWGFVAPVAAKY
jgi:outer membrane immunogenic protein